MNELEKGLKDLDLEYEVNGTQYKVPTNKENLIKLLKCSWAMQLDLQHRIQEAIKILENNDDEYAGAVYSALNVLKGEENE